MNFSGLQENLRKDLHKRVAAGELTGTELARRTRFTQAHISNFLNRKRGLKLSALDRMLKALGLKIYDLLNPHDLARFAAAPASKDADYAAVPLVGAEVAAASEVILNEDVEEMHKIRHSLLNRIHADLATPARRSWTRFVFIKLTGKECASLAPRIGAGGLLLIDRHYNSLRQYHKNERNLFAVRREGGLVVRYVEPGDRMLILRPDNSAAAVELLRIPEGQNSSDLIVGRIAMASSEI